MGDVDFAILGKNETLLEQLSCKHSFGNLRVLQVVHQLVEGDILSLELIKSLQNSLWLLIQILNLDDFIHSNQVIFLNRDVFVFREELEVRQLLVLLIHFDHVFHL